ncbi:hypothetical protein B0H14DRAFT_2789265 [Mycena olivaceomarginata]|nr:hypothetical protein B0H14DRAFT_2789265 [Mycena olivaceomarginata]
MLDDTFSAQMVLLFGSDSVAFAQSTASFFPALLFLCGRAERSEGANRRLSQPYWRSPRDNGTPDGISEIAQLECGVHGSGKNRRVVAACGFSIIPLHCTCAGRPSPRFAPLPMASMSPPSDSQDAVSPRCDSQDAVVSQRRRLLLVPLHRTLAGCRRHRPRRRRSTYSTGLTGRSQTRALSRVTVAL